MSCANENFRNRPLYHQKLPNSSRKCWKGSGGDCEPSTSLPAVEGKDLEVRMRVFFHTDRTTISVSSCETRCVQTWVRESYGPTERQGSKNVITIEVPQEITLAFDSETSRKNHERLAAAKQKIHAALDQVNALIIANQTICRHTRVRSDICSDCGKHLDS